MKGTMKKIISVVLALAMVVTGLQYSPSTAVSAAADGYTTTAPQNGVAVEYKVTTNNMVDLNSTGGFMDDNGRRFVITYNAQYTPENTIIKVDGTTVTKTENYDGWIFNQFAGGVHFVTTNMPTDSYSTIQILDSKDDSVLAEISVKKIEEEQTTAAPAVPTYVGTGLVISLLNNDTTVYFAGLNTAFEGNPAPTSYKLYVDDVEQTGITITNGANIPVSSFSAGSHTFKVSAVNSIGESNKSTGTVLVIPGETTTAAPETTTEEPTTEAPLNWQTDENLTAYFGAGTKYAYRTTNVGGGTDKFLGGNFTFNANNMNCTSGAHGDSQTYTFNGKEISSSDSSYAVGENIAYTEFNPGMNTAVFTGHYTAGNSDINVTCTMYIDVPNKPLALSINDYSTYTGKYIAKFKEANNVVGYKVYVDGNATSIDLGGSGDFFTVAELNTAGYSTGTHTITIKGVDGENQETPVSNAISITVPATAGTNGDIAQIYIQTDNTNLSPTPQNGKETMLKTPHDKQEAAITVVDKDGGNGAYTVFEDLPKTTVKVRGNSTAGAVKKAYNITFGSGKDLFGLDGSASPAKKWSLLANAFDKSLIRNYLGFDIAHHMWANGTTPDYNSQCKFVDLYFNGVYLGSYLLIESVETGAGRVNIDSENSETYNSEALLELEEIHAIGEEAHFTTTRYDQTFIFGSPEVVKDIGNNAEFFAQKQTDVAGYFNNFEDDLYSKDWEDIQDDIDVESFVKIYVLNEIMTTKDFNQSSTRFYVHNGKIYGGPIWDMDYSSDNNLDHPAYTKEYQIDAPGHSMPWFEHLMEIPEFKALVVAEYKSIRPYVMSLYADNGGIDTMVAGIAGSAARNYASAANGGAGWSLTKADNGDEYGYMQMLTNGVQGATPYTSYNNENDTHSAVYQVKNYFEKRIEGLDETWDVSYEASVSTENNQVIVSWDAMDGATGYRLTFSGKHTAPGASSVPAPLMVQQIDNNYTTQTVDVAAGTTSYNLTINGYEVEDGTDITVAYRTDSGSTYTTLDSVTYNAPAPEPEYASITDWTKLSGTSESGASIYVPTEMITNNLFGDAGLRGFYGAGKTNHWNITAGVGIDTVPVFGFCTTGTNPSSVFIDDVEYDGDDDTATDVVAKLNTVYINQNLVDASAGETNYYQISATGSNTGTFWIKVVGAIDPATSVDTTINTWTEVTNNTSGASIDLNKYYIQTSTYTNYINTDIYGVFNEDAASYMPQAGKDKLDTNTVSFAIKTLGTPLVEVWIDGKRYTNQSSEDIYIERDQLHMSTDLFALGNNESSHVFKMAFVGTNSTEAFAFKVVAPEEETTTEETTTEEPTTEEPTTEEPTTEAPTWITIKDEAGQDTVYSYLSSTTATVGNVQQPSWASGKGIYVSVPAGINSVTANGDSLASQNIQGAGAIIPESSLGVGDNTVVITYNGTQTATIQIRKARVYDYVPTGLAVSRTGVVSWTRSADAIEVGATYTVTFNNTDIENITSGSATLDLTGVEYDTYTVTLKTVVDGNVVDTQNISYTYRDLEAVYVNSFAGTGTLIQNSAPIVWEMDRKDHITWDVDDERVVGYVVYVDGDKYQELEDDATGINVPSYVLATSTDKNNQASNVGNHTISVVALFEGDEVKDTFAETNAKRLVGTDSFTLNVNYIWGDTTDLWNDTGVDSKWNFTITPGENDAASMKVKYYNDGSVDLEDIDSAGAWSVKAAIYDSELELDEEDGYANISFDITLTDADTIQRVRDGDKISIGIKAVADEVVKSGNGYAYAGEYYNSTQGGDRWVYQDPAIDGTNAEYEFEYDEQTGTAVIHYSLTFKPVLETYDLLFDLHNLHGASINLSDAVAKDIYKVTQVVGSPIPNGEDITNSSIQVGWNTNVPEHLAHNYYYKVYIDGYTVSDNATLNDVYDTVNENNIGAGEYTVKVESYYGLPAGQDQEETGVKTGEATATVNIVQEEKPNLVITDLSIPDGTYYAGDTVTITVKMKNIGNAPAVPEGGNLISRIYKKAVSDNAEINIGGYQMYYQLDWPEAQKIPIAVDEERIATIDYTIQDSDVGNVTFRAVADQEAHVAELSENDNEKVVRYKFYEHVKVLNLTNDGTNVKATWPTITGTPDSAEIVYTTVDNVEHKVPISTSATEYTFPATLKNNTSVTVETVYGTDEINYAQGTALADLVATSVETNAYLDEDNAIVFTVKNQGTAQATASGFTLWANEGEWTWWNNTISLDLAPNETMTGSVLGYHPTTVGTKTIEYKVDESKAVPESNEENNNGSFTVTVVDRPKPDLVITSVTTDKEVYKVGDVVHVSMVMTNTGGAEAVSTGGNILFKLIKNDVIQEGTYSTTGIKSLAVNGTISYIFDYTVTAADYTQGYIDFGGRADGDNVVAEGTAGEANNISENVRVMVGDSGTVSLTNTNDVISASWNEGTKATGYKISYTSNGTTYTEVIDTTSGSPNATLVEGTYTYTFSRPLDQASTVDITATYDDTITGESAYYDYATTVAKADLIITNVVSSTNVYKVKIPFSLTATVKNTGTAQVMPSPSGADDVEVDYAYWLGINMPAIAPNVAQVIGTHTINGLAVGSTVDLQINNINVQAQGNYNLVIKADDLGYEQQAEGGHISESNEANNTYTFPVTVTFEQHDMDWTPFYTSASVVSGDDVLTNGNKEAKGNVSNLPNGTKVVNINNGSDWRPMEYKILATNIDDIDFADIATQWESNNGQYTVLKFNENYAMVQSGAGGVTTKLHFAQVHEEDIEDYTYATDSNINYTERTPQDGVLQTFDGNGWSFHTRSFAPGKYYIAKLTNEDSANTENYIVVAFRVPGDIGTWVRANASDDSDPEKVPLSFHRGTNIVDGTVYYDAEDLGLAGITVYNGNHITLTTDGSCTLNVPDAGQTGDPHWHMTIQYAHLDENNNDEFTAGIAADDLAEIGTDPGEITLNPTNEVFGWQGKNTLLIKFPELIEQIPIHSPEGGSTDSEYYLLKVYYDDVNHPQSYINIPLKMVPNVPAIIEPQEYTVRAGIDSFHVHFTETNAQAVEDYKYTFYVKLNDGDMTQITSVKKDDETVTGGIATEGGNYELLLNSTMQEALQTNGSQFTIEVKAEWCQQETTVSTDYEVELKDGTVDVEGFQINTNTAEGGVSEYMPTFRAVAHSSKYFLGTVGAAKDKLVAVREQGIIFAQTEKAGTVNASTMILNDESDYIEHIAATAAGMHDWGGKEIDTNYFSLTIKEMNYYFDNLEKEYSFRAYAILDDGEVRYGDHIYTVSTYEIAQNLYENQKMSTVEGHNFLYNEVLNIVSMNKHANQIFNAMYKAIKPQFGDTIDQTTYTSYLQKFSKDMVYYTQCINGYKYKTRPVGSDFVSVQLGTTVQGQLLDALNNAQEANYDTVFDWIKNETSNYSTKGTPYQGFYKEVEYGWENAYSSAFETE